MLTILHESCGGEATFTAEDGGAFAGKISIAVSGERASVNKFDFGSNDPYIIDGLCRAALSYAEKAGAETMYFGNFEINVNNTDYSGLINIKSFFNKNCKNSL